MHVAQPDVIVDFEYGWSDISSLGYAQAIANADSFGM